MKYRAALFDLWGTLAHPFPGAEWEEQLYLMADTVNVPREVFSQLWNHETWPRRAAGTFPTIASNIEYICRQSGTSVLPERISEAAQIRHAFTQYALRPRADAAATLIELRERGVRLGLLSDCSAEVPDIWFSSELAPLIDAPVFSCRSGTKKPDAALYRAACEQLGVTPSECVYIADGYSNKLAAATALGMHAVLVAPPDEVPSDFGGWEGAHWTGTRVSGLQEVLSVVAW